MIEIKKGKKKKNKENFTDLKNNTFGALGDVGKMDVGKLVDGIGGGDFKTGLSQIEGLTKKAKSFKTFVFRVICVIIILVLLYIFYKIYMKFIRKKKIDIINFSDMEKGIVNILDEFK
jgi:hypothetical protein